MTFVPKKTKGLVCAFSLGPGGLPTWTSAPHFVPVAQTEIASTPLVAFTTHLPALRGQRCQVAVMAISDFS